MVDWANHRRRFNEARRRRGPRVVGHHAGTWWNHVKSVKDWAFKHHGWTPSSSAFRANMASARNSVRNFNSQKLLTSRRANTAVITAAEVAAKKSMAPYKRKRHHGYLEQNMGTSKKHKLSSGAVKYMSSAAPGVHGHLSTHHGTRINLSSNYMKGAPDNHMVRNATVKTFHNKRVKKVKGRKRKVKVSKKLRDKVNKVIEGHKAFGSYTKIMSGTIGFLVDGGLTNVYLTQNIGDYLANTIYARLGTSKLTGNSRMLYGTLPRDNNPVQGMETVYFTPAKFLDAASVLFNQKGPALDYSIQARNFQIQVNKGTGVPNLGTPASPFTANLKLHVINSWVKFEMRNNSQRVMHINMYECVGKQRFPAQMPLECFKSCLNGTNPQVEDGNFTGLVRGFFGIAVDDWWNSAMLKPSVFEAFKSSWSYTLKEIIIEPGVSHVFYLNGPKNMELDYNKMHEGGVDQTASLYNKCSVGVIFEVKGDIKYGTVGAGSATAANSGRWIAGGIANKMIDPVSIEVTEVYKISCPETSGFILQAVATAPAGTPQALNFRRPQYAFLDVTGTEDTTAILYQDPSEENPGVLIPQSSTN